MKTQDGRLIVVAGASRSGKTAYVARQVRAGHRVAAWDPEAQWCELPGWRKVTTRRALLEALQTPGHVRVAYVAGGKIAEEFDFWCGVVQYARRYVGPLDAVAEELADVTTPSKAPGNWGVLLRRGLKRGGDIYAISQRWAEADKTAMGNASEFVMFMQVTADDELYLARKTRVPAERIAELKPLEFLRYDRATRAVEPGRLRF